MVVFLYFMLDDWNLIHIEARKIQTPFFRLQNLVYSSRIPYFPCDCMNSIELFGKLVIFCISSCVSEDATVKAARNRFKNVLKHMVQDNFLQEEESDSDNENEENRAYKYAYNYNISFKLLIYERKHSSGNSIG